MIRHLLWFRWSRKLYKRNHTWCRESKEEAEGPRQVKKIKGRRRERYEKNDRRIHGRERERDMEMVNSIFSLLRFCRDTAELSTENGGQPPPLSQIRFRPTSFRPWSNSHLFITIVDRDSKKTKAR